MRGSWAAGGEGIGIDRMTPQRVFLAVALFLVIANGVQCQRIVLEGTGSTINFKDEEEDDEASIQFKLDKDQLSELLFNGDVVFKGKVYWMDRPTLTPTATTLSPTATTQNPTTTTQNPTSTTQVPTQTPTSTTRTPTSTTQAPTSTTQTPTSTTQAPTSTTQAPTSTTQAPTSTTQAPTSTTQAPTSTTQAPTSTTQTPTQAPTILTATGPNCLAATVEECRAIAARTDKLEGCCGYAFAGSYGTRGCYGYDSRGGAYEPAMFWGGDGDLYTTTTGGKIRIADPLCNT